jgi:hypothetical protein
MYTTCMPTLFIRMPICIQTVLRNICIATCMSTYRIAKLVEKTKLSLNSSKRHSLRTTVPISVVRQWDLKVGDELAWSWEVRKGEMTLIVNKATNKK